MSTEPVIPLPERPNLEQLKKLAREKSTAEGVPLNEAQLLLARGYGFASWPKLKAYVEMVTRFTRMPDTVAADDFVALACLTYGNDSPDRWRRAMEMLLADPALAARDSWSAAAAANADAITDATTPGGPFDWEPLMYLCYARLFPSTEADVLATADKLLDAGADPNVGYLWHGFPTPFTALTGVFGGGEGSQPPHPHAEALARRLLERGANPNDAQTLYNRQFTRGTTHLALLFEFGLGTGDGGPWQARLGAQMETPFAMVQHQLRWAIHHNHVDRVRLFAERGVDLHTPFDNEPAWAEWAAGRTPADWAVLCGNTEIALILAAYGATPTSLSPVDEWIGGCLAGTSGTTSDDVWNAAIAQRPSLVVQAARTGRATAVMAAVAAGFDANALGRADAPCEMPWQTALHTAVEHDDVAMVKLLLDLGADPSIEDARFHATPKGWAEHFGHAAVAALFP